MSHHDIHNAALRQIFAALADPLRLQIVQRVINEGQLGCGQIDHRLSPATVSHHCKVLRQAGIVQSHPLGNQRILTLHPEFVRQFPSLIENISLAC